MRALLLLGFVLVGCTAEATLIVQVRTDLRPGLELDSIRTQLGGVNVAMTRADMGREWSAGVRVAELRGLELGDQRLVVSALDSAGDVIVERPVRVTLEGGTRVVTVLLTRSCEGVTCDDPAANACLGGRCVPADCVEDDPAMCGAGECTGPEMCAVAACAAAECTPSGACFAIPDHDACGSDEICDGSTGCVPVDGPPSAFDLYVDDDAVGAPGQNGTAENPYESIAAALAVAGLGVRVRVLMGTYVTAGLSVDSPGLEIHGEGSGLVRVVAPTMSGHDGAAFTIDANDVQLSGMQIEWFGRGVHIDSAERVGLTDLAISNVNPLTTAAIGIDAVDSPGLALGNIVISSVSPASMVDDTEVIGIRLREIVGCNLDGIRISDVRGSDGNGFSSAPPVYGMHLIQVTDCGIRDVAITGISGGASAAVTGGQTAGRGGGAWGLATAATSARIDVTRLLVSAVTGGPGGDATGSGAIAGDAGVATGVHLTVDQGSLRNVTIANLEGGLGGVGNGSATSGLPSNPFGLIISTSDTFVVRNYILAGIRGICMSSLAAQVDADYGLTYGCSTVRTGDFNVGPAGGTISEPFFVDEAAGDYHLIASSQAIDLGEPTDACMLEPAPNGCRINAGYYGGSAEAAVTPVTMAADCDNCPMMP